MILVNHAIQQMNVLENNQLLIFRELGVGAVSLREIHLFDHRYIFYF